MKLLVLLLGAEAAVLALEVAHRGVRTLSVVEGFPHLTAGRNYGEGQVTPAMEAGVGGSRVVTRRNRLARWRPKLDLEGWTRADLHESDVPSVAQPALRPVAWVFLPR